MNAIAPSASHSSSHGLALRSMRISALVLALLCLPPLITPSVAGSNLCVGDCNGNRRTTVDELVRLVNLALSGAAVAACTAGDVDGNQRITVEELVSGVRTSLAGCAALPPSVDADSLCFSGVAAAASPSDQSISISKATGTWTAAASASWITLTPLQGSAPGMTRVTIDASGLAEGVHLGAVTIGDESGSEATVAITLNLARQGVSPGWSIQTVAPVISAGQGQESIGSPAQQTSLALAPDGRPGITFYRNDVLIDRELQLARFTGCAWETESIEKRGIDAALAFDSNGRPHVSYGRQGTQRYAHKPADTWLLETVEQQEPRGDTGHRGSIAIDGSGRPHIAFLLKFLPNNVFTYDLHYAVRTGDNTWTIETPDAEGTTGWDTSLVLANPGDAPRVTYHTDGSNALRYAEKRGDTWVTETVSLDGKPSSLRLDAEGRPRVAFNGLPGDSVNYAQRIDDEWQVETIDQQGGGPRGTNRPFVSLAIDSAGVSHVAYVDFNRGALKYATRTGDDQWNIQVIDEGLDTGDFCSLQIDRQDVAHISYLDLTVGVLKYARGPARP